MLNAAVGPGWPWHGSGVLGGIAVGVAMLALALVLPCGWWVLRRYFGAGVAGPLWPLVFFEVVALGYALVVPPWQKPDEPQHMVHVEVTRVAGANAAERLLPWKPPDRHLIAVEEQAERNIADSMRATKATRWLPFSRAAIDADRVPGPPQLAQPPLYYVVSGFLLRPFGGTPVVARLALLRILGVAMAGCIVWCCAAAGRLLFRARDLSELPALVAVAIPGFVLSAGSVNNDVLAELFAALLVLLLLVGVLERSRVARPLPWLVGIAVLVALGLLTKRTLLPLAAVAVIAVAIRLLRRPRAMVIPLAVLGIVVGVSVLAGSYPRLALWHRASSVGSARCRPASGAGWAICLTPSSFQVSQNVPLVKLDKLKGGEVRVNLVARGSGRSPMLDVDLNTGGASLARSLEPLSDGWRSISFQGRVPPSAPRLSLALTLRGSGLAYVDNVRLAPASDPSANAIVNGSGSLGNLAAPRILPGSARRAVDSAVDAATGLIREPLTVIDSRGIIARQAEKTFGSFWGQVGWQGPLLLFPGPLAWALSLLGLAGLAGFIAVALGGPMPRRPLLLILTATLLVLASVVLRTVPPDDIQLVSGRYLYTGMVAFAVTLAAGWRQLWPWTDRTFHASMRLAPIVTHVLFVTLVLAPFLVNGVHLKAVG